jgi:hypothetical protein
VVRNDEKETGEVMEREKDVVYACSLLYTAAFALHYNVCA